MSDEGGATPAEAMQDIVPKAVTPLWGEETLGAERFVKGGATWRLGEPWKLRNVVSPELRN